MKVAETIFGIRESALQISFNPFLQPLTTLVTVIETNPIRPVFAPPSDVTSNPHTRQREQRKRHFNRLAQLELVTAFQRHATRADFLARGNKLLPIRPGDTNLCHHGNAHVTSELVEYEHLRGTHKLECSLPFDRFMAEGRDSTVINAAAKRGARLFVGKASCFNCHNTPLFSNRFFNNVAVATTGPLELTTADCPAGDPVCDCATPGRATATCLPWGALTGLELLRSFPLRRDSAASDDPADPTVKEFLAERLGDLGAAPPDAASGLPSPLPASLKWRWKTPSLRNVALTAPYMHNGRYATLAEVIEHYDRGGDEQAPGPLATLIKPLALTADEKADLEAFLLTLTSAPWPAAIAQAPSLPLVPLP